MPQGPSAAGTLRRDVPKQERPASRNPHQDRSAAQGKARGARGTTNAATTILVRSEGLANVFGLNLPRNQSLFEREARARKIYEVRFKPLLASCIFAQLRLEY